MLTDDIASYLQTAGIGTIGSSIFIGHMPDVPTSCIALYQYAGEAPLVVGGIENPRLTVRVRNATYLNGQNKARDVLKALHTLNEQTISAHRYLYIRAAGSIAQLGRDHEGRTLFTIDFIVTKELEG